MSTSFVSRRSNVFVTQGICCIQNNIAPRTRSQRRAVMDKESLEKDRLKRRFGGKDGRATRNQDFSDSNHTHTTMHPEAQGYCPEAQRFICGGFDVAGEEKQLREKRIVHSASCLIAPSSFVSGEKKIYRDDIPV